MTLDKYKIHEKRCRNCGDLFRTADHRQQHCTRGCSNVALARRTLARRFWSRVQKTDTCWLWTAATFRGNGGYGRFSGIESQLAHRTSWMLAFGSIPNGTLVLHRCDVRTCVNPDHLFLGSHQDNVDDMMAKGREAPPLGSRHGMAKLTDDEVEQIRVDTRSQSVIAGIYRISQTQVGRIKRGVNWKQQRGKLMPLRAELHNISEGRQSDR